MNSNYKYPTHIDIKYTNTTEYRSCIRTIFQMSTKKYPHDYINKIEDLDEITRDELEYDDDAAYDTMNYIYEKTKNNKIFDELYTLSAARMMSIDKEIGLPILFSYDYLELFHICLCDFFDDPVKITKTNDIVIELYRRLK